MKIKRFLALTAMILGVGFFGASQAHAQVVCTQINSMPTQWPPAASALSCGEGSDLPAYDGVMRSVLEDLGNRGDDASQRIKEAQIATGEVISIQLIDTSLSGGSTTVTHTTVSTDSLFSISTDLAAQINNVPNFYASAWGNVITIYSFTGNTTTYSMTTSMGATSSITAGDDGFGNETATISAPLNSQIIWYDFWSQFDFISAAAPVNKPTNGTFNDRAAVTYHFQYLTPSSENELYSAVWEFDGNTVPVPILKSVTAHETGHHLDKIYGELFGLGVDTDFSSGTDFRTALSRDLAAMALLRPCKTLATDARAVDENQNPTGGYYTNGTDQQMAGDGVGGIYSYVQNSTGAYICGASGDGYGGGNPVTIGAAAFPRISFEDTEDGASEIFAEEFAVLEGFYDLEDNSGSPVHGSDYLFRDTNAFACTRLYVEKLAKLGRLPTSEELANTGYAVPEELTSGPDSGMLWGTHFHACDGTVGDFQRFNFGT